jgi:oxygen-independent coproporphyrinogen-3 oxidase
LTSSFLQKEFLIFTITYQRKKINWQNEKWEVNLHKIQALYLHFPFCKQKCYYCDFNSYAGLDSLAPEYIKALWREIERYLPQTAPLTSVYFGGGTPSCLPTELLSATLAFLKEHFEVTPQTEITIEINPGTADGEKLLELQSAGFNRLSIGLQAAQDKLLETIGRIHNWNDFVTCYQQAREVGFTNIGVDLIFGLPRQTKKQWRETLRRVVGLNPEHLSAYGLQLEPGTILREMVEKQRLTLPEEDTVAAMLELTMEYLPAAGYEHYEISNYAKPGRRSAHNLGYWRGRDYLGFGAGAYSTVAGERWYNVKEPQVYIGRMQTGRAVVAERESLNRRTAAAEALMLGLRLREGINLPQYVEQHEIDLLKKSRGELVNLFAAKLIDRQGDYLFLTDKGLLLSNYVTVRLMGTL